MSKKTEPQSAQLNVIFLAVFNFFFFNLAFLMPFLRFPIHVCIIKYFSRKLFQKFQVLTIVTL